MIKASSGINYKEGKYFFKGIRKRDVVIFTVIIAISLIILFNTHGTEDDPLFYLKVLFCFNAFIFALMMPTSIFKSNYMYLYYLYKHFTKPKKYVWKGLLWRIDEKE